MYMTLYSFSRIYWIIFFVACQKSRVSRKAAMILSLTNYNYYVDSMIIPYLKKRRTATMIRMRTNTAVPTIPAINPTLLPSLSSFTMISVLGERVYSIF